VDGIPRGLLRCHGRVPGHAERVLHRRGQADVVVNRVALRLPEYRADVGYNGKDR